MTFDPVAFWRSLSREQVIALARHAPKIAGPWVDAAPDGARRYVVSSPIGSLRLYAACVMRGARGWTAVGTSLGHTSVDDAKASADTALIASGWMLLESLDD